MPGTQASERGWATALSAAGAPASGAFAVRIRKGAHILRGLSGVSLAPPGPRVPARFPGPQASRGRDWRGRRQGGTWKNHPDCIAVGEAAGGGAGSPSRPPAGRSPARGPRRARLRGRGACAGPARRRLVRGEQPAPPTHTPGGRLLLKKCYNCSGSPCPTRPFRPLVSGSGSAFWVNANLITCAFAGDPRRWARWDRTSELTPFLKSLVCFLLKEVDFLVTDSF